MLGGTKASLTSYVVLNTKLIITVQELSRVPRLCFEIALSGSRRNGLTITVVVRHYREHKMAGSCKNND